MDTSSFGVVIMAAGKGTRLRSRRPKVLHEIGGRALLAHVIDAAKTVVPADHIYCVIGHEAERVRSAVEHTGVGFVLQAEQRGTGHALQMVKAEFALNGTEPPANLLVLSGDVPLIRPETIRALMEFHGSERAAMTILTAIPSDPTGYGRVLRHTTDSSAVRAIVEQKDLKPGEDSEEINSGIYCFETAALFSNLERLNDQNASGEFYLTDVAALLVSEGRRVVATVAPHIDEVLGANTIAEMMHLDAAMRSASARRLMASGVTIFRPETCVIDAAVEVAADTVIEPFVQILGNTRIGSDCRIRSYSVIQNSNIGNGVLVRNGCILDEVTVGDGALLGPYAHLRAGSDIGPAAHIGNFVETKKVRMGRGSKANHLTYLGDAIIGSGTNIGAGSITCNYDGVHKHTTTIGDNVFIGSDSTLVAPVTVGDAAYVAAASCITEDVPPDALALGRSRQVTKEGWVAARKARKASS
ncbi:MAG TPA: bifunctional UDP-N-acetylglucosamine diphosphorylase/glucosamine-1-phosphate N-acetyltransferase GlmU [Acidobacteriaceae bacterium]|nr:bifunctional UDP-N-acetylglucosamine diphosphorylase/glucosamine-1-phosphate N-acetyltransferase GlmU [Acidobacteriaceae bacterium]